MVCCLMRRDLKYIVATMVARWLHWKRAQSLWDLTNGPVLVMPILWMVAGSVYPSGLLYLSNKVALCLYLISRCERNAGQYGVWSDLLYLLLAGEVGGIGCAIQISGLRSPCLSPFTVFRATFVQPRRIRRVFICSRYVVDAPPISQMSLSWYSSDHDWDHPVSTDDGLEFKWGRCRHQILCGWMHRVERNCFTWYYQYARYRKEKWKYWLMPLPGVLGGIAQ